MPVITLAALVVVPENALALDNIGQTVFECVLRWRDRFRDAPHGDLGERV